MEANTIILLVGFVTIVLAIFASAWLNQRAFERTLEQLEKRFEARFDAVEQRFQSLEARFEARFQAVEQRLDRIERQLEQIFKPILPR